jgi:hypothetical protein
VASAVRTACTTHLLRDIEIGMYSCHTESDNRRSL